MIVSSEKNEDAVTCTTDEGCDQLWKEKDRHIVSVKYGHVIGLPIVRSKSVADIEVPLILCEKKGSWNKFKFEITC